MDEHVLPYASQAPRETWSEKDKFLLAPFATGLGGSVHVILRNLPPEIAGALCSRASRAPDSLLRVLLKEYFYPILEGDNAELAKDLQETVALLHRSGFKQILNNQRAQQFYAKWLSQYGDDSIAQLTGSHLLFDGISQVALKYIEDQRIGLEPIEKSTRYVNFGNKTDGKYLYFTPAPDLRRLGLLDAYRETIDGLFDAYVALLPRMIAWLKSQYDEKESILEKKAFDSLRGLLPMATLGQVAFRGNAQAFEYLLNRAWDHHLGELRWIARAAKRELDEEIPSLLLRLEGEKAAEYRRYMMARTGNALRAVSDKARAEIAAPPDVLGTPRVRLVEYDPEGTEKVVAGILFPATNAGWEHILRSVSAMSDAEKSSVLEAYCGGRKERWHKVGRAFESAYLRFEISMNIGAYRDLHRHRMMTQERQLFSVRHGYDVPQEVVAAGLGDFFESPLRRAGELFEKIVVHDPELAQYAVPLAYRVRFYQWQNFRQFFWETELRTISQGHPDYRLIEQEKYRLVKEKFPLIAKLMMVDERSYDLPRRGTDEKIAAKEKEIIEKLAKKDA